MQPGQTITPGGPAQNPSENNQQGIGAQGLQAPQAQPQIQSQVPMPSTAQAPSPQPAQPEANWQYQNDNQQSYDDAPEPAHTGDTVQWSASEFVHHEKSSNWYLLLILATIVVAVGIFLLTRDFITMGAIILVALAFGLVAARKPRTLEYEVNESGILISGKYYPFNLFKSFSVVDEDQASSAITLLPTKRFMPLVTMYYPLDQEDEIVEVLGEYLPYEHRESDTVDNIMRRLRF
jgi:hypothetical protein